MKNIVFYALAALLLTSIYTSSSFAQNGETGQSSRFSHKGFKAALAFGGAEIPSQSNLKEGQAVNVHLGYGFSNHSSLWLSLVGTEFTDKITNDVSNKFSALELSYAYKVRSNSRLQPYGRIGVGIYVLETVSINTRLHGGGFLFGVGADYFLTRHIGLGVELMFKDIEYLEIEGAGGNTVAINPHLNRDARALMFAVTIQ